MRAGLWHCRWDMDREFGHREPNWVSSRLAQARQRLRFDYESLDSQVASADDFVDFTLVAADFRCLFLSSARCARYDFPSKR